MKIIVKRENDKNIAVIQSNDIIITDVGSALDFIATVSYESNCNYIVINKSAICEDFFALKTKLAGEILQKFVNYDVKLAIIGDFSIYTSKSLNDFIYECNNGKHIFFLKDEEQAIQKLSLI